MLYYLFLFILLFFISIAFVIYVHKFFYRFWIKHPMPWTTLQRCSPGIISHSPPPPVEPVPEHYSMHYYFTDVSKLMPFLNKNYIHPNTPFQAAYTTDHLSNLLSCGKCNVLQYQKEVVGVIFYYKVMMNQTQQCYWIDKLCIDMQHRGKHLSGVLISHTIYNEYNQQPIVAIFHKDKIMPFPEFYSCKSYFAVINPVLQPQEKMIPPGKVTTLQELEQLPIPQNDLYFDITSNKKIWEMLLQDPQIEFLSFNEEIFVCVQQLPIELKNHPDIHIYSILLYIGQTELVVKKILSHLCQTQKDEFLLVFPNELISFATDAKWQLFDLQNYYFYNYRVNKKSGNKPLYFPFSCF